MTSDGGRAVMIVRFTDVWVLLMAIPFALAFGAPALGVGVGIGGWIVQRLIGELIARRAAGDARKALMTGLVFSMARVWVLALMILAVGKAASREDGLACALVVLVAFTIYFAMSLILRSAPGRAHTS